MSQTVYLLHFSKWPLIDLERIRIQIAADSLGVEIDPWEFSDDEIREYLIQRYRQENLRKARYLLHEV